MGFLRASSSTDDTETLSELLREYWKPGQNITIAVFDVKTAEAKAALRKTLHEMLDRIDAPDVNFVGLEIANELPKGPRAKAEQE